MKLKILFFLIFSTINICAQPLICHDCDQECHAINQTIFNSFNNCLEKSGLLGTCIFYRGVITWYNTDKEEGVFARSREPDDETYADIEYLYVEYDLERYSGFLNALTRTLEDLKLSKNEFIKPLNRTIRNYRLERTKSQKRLAEIEILLQSALSKQDREKAIRASKYHQDMINHYNEQIIQHQCWINKHKIKYTNNYRNVCETEKKINKLYLERFDWCYKNHQNFNSLYERGLLKFKLGQNIDFLDDIKLLLQKAKEQNRIEDFQSELLNLKGKCEVELGLYHDAIINLSESIQINPDNKDAYFERAGAYFETGNFEMSLKDYILSEKKSDPIKGNTKDILDFSIGISKGAAVGVSISIQEFIPSMLSSAFGLGECIWAFASEPVQVSANLVRAVRECCDFVRNNSSQEILKKLVPELKELIENWETIEESQKGEKCGYILGKYGVDIFAGSCFAKCMAAYRELKIANNLLSFETITLNERNQKLILTETLKRSEAKKQILKSANLKIQADKQGKHIKTHKNFRTCKSEITHFDPQILVDKFAGTGQRINKTTPGKPDYKERIDFGEIIGIYKDGKNNIAQPTTVGMIIYAKDGTHIVPLRPKDFNGNKIQ